MVSTDNKLQELREKGIKQAAKSQKLVIKKSKNKLKKKVVKKKPVKKKMVKKVTKKNKNLKVPKPSRKKSKKEKARTKKKRKERKAFEKKEAKMVEPQKVVVEKSKKEKNSGFLKNIFGNEKKKKKVRRKKTHPKPKGPIDRKDFETFQFGVERLKELRKEFESLDTSGFHKEAMSIRSKLKDVSQIPYVEREMRNLKKKIAGKYRVKHRYAQSRIDAGVDVLVDTHFNAFLSDLKKAISQRVRNKEQATEEHLHQDLILREKKYKEKHLNLIKEFNAKNSKLSKDYEDKYNLDVKIKLGKEVAEKFEDRVRKELREREPHLLEKYKKDLRAEFEEKLKQKIKKVHEEKREFEKQCKERVDRIESSKKRFEEQCNKKVDEAKKEYEEKERSIEASKKRFEEQCRAKTKKHEEEMKKKLSQVLGG